MFRGDVMSTNLKFTKKNAIIIILVIFIIISAVIILSSSHDKKKLDTFEARYEYLMDLGWEIDVSTEEFEEILIPREFNESFTQYNDLQLTQGFDLRDYYGLYCTRYCYKLENYPNGNDKVYIQIFIYDGEIIAGDIHSVNLDGFIHGLVRE